MLDHPAPRKKTVMICDDEQDVSSIRAALESKYNVILASSGEDCIDKFIEEKIGATKYILYYWITDWAICLAILFSWSDIKQYNGTIIVLILHTI